MTKFQLSGAWIVFISAVLNSTNAPLVKMVGLDSTLVCGLRAAIAAVAFAPFIRPKLLKWNGWLLLYALSSAFLSLSVITALQMTSAAIAVGMQFTSPVWLFIFGLLGREKFQWQSFISVALIFLGVVLFMTSGGADGATGLGNIVALSSGLFFALMSIGSKKTSGQNPLGAAAIAHLTTALVSYAFLPASFENVFNLTSRQWYIMIFLGVFQIGAASALYNLGLRKISPQKASIIALWEMILGPVWVAAFLHEYPSVRIMSGLIVILLGLAYNALPKAVMTRQADTETLHQRRDSRQRGDEICSKT